MASFTGVGDNTALTLRDKGEQVLISISGTYNMTILFQIEQGAPGSGAWQTVKTYSTANATVSEIYTTKAFNETVRLIVDVDTSGTATATLTDNSALVHDPSTIRDRAGNVLLEFEQGGAGSVGGNMVRHGGQRWAENGVVSVTASTVTITPEEHAGRVVVLNRAAGITATLPAATGTGDEYTFFVGTTVTSNADIIEVASAADVIQGGLAIATDIAGVVLPTASTTDTITMSGTTTGGIIGSLVRVKDVAAGVFMLDGFLVSSGAEATPFSADVS